MAIDPSFLLQCLTVRGDSQGTVSRRGKIWSFQNVRVCLQMRASKKHPGCYGRRPTVLSMSPNCSWRVMGLGSEVPGWEQKCDSQEGVGKGCGWVGRKTMTASEMSK